MFTTTGYKTHHIVMSLFENTMLQSTTITSKCEDPDGNIANNVVMGVLGFMTFVTYIPMMWALYEAKTSRGVSLLMMFLVNITNYSNTIGVGLQNWQSMICCGQKWSTLTCVEGLNPFFLIAANIVGSLPVYYLLVYYFNEPGVDADGDEEEGSQKSGVSAVTASSYISQNLIAHDMDVSNVTKQHAVWSLVSFHIYVVITIAISTIFLWKTGLHSDEVKYYADVMNILSGVAMAFSWIPQIITTYKMKDVGSLSVLTVLLQAPGSAIVCVTMIINGQNFTSISPFAVSFICLSVLLVLCIKYEHIDKRKNKKKKDSDKKYDDLPEDGEHEVNVANMP